MRYYALTSRPLPNELLGAEPEIALRKLTREERYAIEDFFFWRDQKVAVADGTTAIVIQRASLEKGPALEEIATLIEFGSQSLTISGFQRHQSIRGTESCGRSF